MEPTHEPWVTPAEPTVPHSNPADDAVVAYLRARAPGVPAVRFDTRGVIARARRSLRRRRLRTSLVAAACATTVYFGLALAGPVPVPGGGTVSVPGSHALRALVADAIPAQAPGPEDWNGDLDRIERYILPVLNELQVSYYLLEDGPCRILQYSRGNYSDQDQCEEMTPFDAQATADFNKVTKAVERSGVAVERLGRELTGYYIRLKDSSWQYNWSYVYMPGIDSPPPINFPEERWTRIRGDWWFHRAHDD